MAINIDLTTVWAFIIAFAVFMYVVMDGFDLGIGILFPTFQVGEERDQAMNSIAPVWDGNETWLVLGGGGLLAAFPLAYSVILPATYPPIIAMLLGLIFRGVAFEFRWRAPRHRPLWDLAFSLGSLVAAFCQGVILGAVLQGVRVENQAYAGGWVDWLSPFTMLTGAGVVAGMLCSAPPGSSGRSKARPRYMPAGSPCTPEYAPWPRSRRSARRRRSSITSIGSAGSTCLASWPRHRCRC
ncbi:Cytochrome bd-I ubiquinol oxidase subunit 2 [Sphingomonas jeddahensis]|uniref:Cytochrome bd-I ubiquinol oxidase subunit 2 n=1 Tax=Sphingomonas jeddahensis TaxID=1915074 RepID=A0A1V2EX11_9SPHN|nr:Cytochrome bd-I ubiquinol oxidase subunit 2 [Sphingomonas jeddahensis]